MKNFLIFSVSVLGMNIRRVVIPFFMKRYRNASILLWGLIMLIAGITESRSQTTSNPLNTINAQYIHCVLADNYYANGDSTNEAMLQKLLPALQLGFDQNDIRLHDRQIVWVIDRTYAPELQTQNWKEYDLSNFHNWYSTNGGDPRDFQVGFFQTLAYEAYSGQGTSGGWCRTVVGGGADWEQCLAHELAHTMEYTIDDSTVYVLDGQHHQSRTGVEYTLYVDGGGQYNSSNGKSMGAINIGGRYLNFYTTPTQYNLNSPVYGGDGLFTYYIVDEYGNTGHISVPVDQMYTTNINPETGEPYTCVTEGINNFYNEYGWKIRQKPLSDYGLTPEMVAPQPQVSVSGQSASLANSEAYNVHYPVTTDPNFAGIYYITGTYEVYLYNADNPADGAQIAGPLTVDEAFTNLTGDMDYVIRCFERRSNTLSAPSAPFSVDVTPPTATFTSTVDTLTNSPSFEVTVNFSEPINPATLSLGDISHTNCTLSDLTFNEDNTSATFTVSPINEGEVSVWIDFNRFQDLAGNWNEAVEAWTTVYDASGPQIEIEADEITNMMFIAVVLHLIDQHPGNDNGLELADVEVSGGTPQNFVNYGDSAIFEIASDGQNGAFSVNIPAGAAHDLLGNPSEPSSFEGVKDYEAPYAANGIQCAVGEYTNLSSFPMSISFNENLANFTAGKLVLTNCTVSNFQSDGNGNYSWNVHPLNEGEVKVEIPAGVLEDFPGGNTNTGSYSFSTIYDSTAPAGTMTSPEPSPTNADTIPVTGNISETAVGLGQADFQVLNADMTNYTAGGQEFAFDLVPTGFGNTVPVTVTVPAGSFTDAAGNPNMEIVFSIVSDQMPPNINANFEENNPTNSPILHWQITSNENITLTEENIAVSNGELTDLAGSGNSYTATITPNEGAVEAVVYDYTDAAGNAGDNDTTAITTDYTPPQITISAPDSAFTNEEVEVQFSADEPVTDFDEGDVQASSGEWGEWSNQGDTLFTSTLTTGANAGQTHINVSGDYYDEAGNEGLPVAEFVIDILTGAAGNKPLAGLQVYPNPATDRLFVRSPETIKALALNRTDGVPVESRLLQASPQKAQIDISGLPAGTYLLTITGENSVFVVKITKIR